MSGHPDPTARLTRLGTIAGAVGLAGLLLSVLGWFMAPSSFYFGYLAAWLLWLGVPLGCGALLMTWRLTGGGWGIILRPSLEAGTLTIPALAVLFIPVVLGIHALFPWSNPAKVAASTDLQLKAGYLNQPFFVLRAIALLGLWCAGAWMLTRHKLMSGFGLVAYGLTVSIAGIDWIASLEPGWYTSILGLYVLVSQCLTALALLIVLVSWLNRGLPEPLSLAPGSLNNLGNLLLMLVVLRAYLAFSQFFIIWNGNLPGEIVWYVPRVRGGWGWLAIGLMLIQFALPFAALLFRVVKRRARALLAVAIVLLVSQALDYAWMILPAAPSGAGAALWACASTAGIGGLSLALFARLWRARPELIELPLPGQETA
jgi:hypothetical protein